MLVWLLCTAWLWHMWLVHLRGATPAGSALRKWDWRNRYAVIVTCITTGTWSLGRVDGEPQLRTSTVKATWVLVLLHALLWSIGALGVVKPA